MMTRAMLRNAWAFGFWFEGLPSFRGPFDEVAVFGSLITVYTRLLRDKSTPSTDSPLMWNDHASLDALRC